MRPLFGVVGALVAPSACLSVSLPPDPGPDAADGSSGGMGDGAGDADGSGAASEGGGPDGGVVDGGDAGSFDASTYVEEVLADNPLGYWRFGEADASVAKDFASGFYPGAYLDDGQPVTFGVEGAIVGDPNTAVALGQAWISMGNVSAFNFPGTSAFSLEAWAKPTGKQGTLVGKAAWGPYGYSLALSSTEGLVFSRFSPGSTVAVVRPLGLPVDVWSHVVATYNGAQMALFVNGEQAAPSVATTMSIVGTSAPWGVGKVDQSATLWAGGVDEVAVYGHALAPARITRHYNVGAGK